MVVFPSLVHQPVVGKQVDVAIMWDVSITVYSSSLSLVAGYFQISLLKLHCIYLHIQTHIWK